MPYAAAHIRLTRTIGRSAFAARAAAKSQTKMTAPRLWVTVRCPPSSKSRSGAAPRPAQTSVSPLPARRNRDADSGTTRQAR